MLFLEAFESIWSGLVVFGGHLLIEGYVALKSNDIPKVIGILLLLASIGYIVIHLSKTFLPQYDGVILNLVFTLPMIVDALGWHRPEREQVLGKRLRVLLRQRCGRTNPTELRPEHSAATVASARELAAALLARYRHFNDKSSNTKEPLNDTGAPSLCMQFYR